MSHKEGIRRRVRKSSDKHINYGQLYDSVQFGTSGKTAFFLIKRTIDR